MKKEFRYTVDGGNFTKEQREFYEENGYIIFKKLIPNLNIDACNKRFVEICNGGNHSVALIMKDKSLKEKGNVKGEYLINKIQDFLYEDVFFYNYANHPNIVSVIKSIIGPNITGMHSMLINKPPDASYDFSRHPIHQDLHYFPFRPADRIVASWTAMERINEENGCLFVIPGSHKSKLFPHVYPSEVKNMAYHGIQGFDDVPKINLVMEKGDTVFFHPLILHGSGPNLSKGFRKAISVHYADSNCNFIDITGTTQEDVAEEVIQIARNIRGITIKLDDIWRLKSRLVTGIPGNFQKIPSNL